MLYHPPSSAVRWAVIRMGIVSRSRKAQATGVVIQCPSWGPIKEANVHPLTTQIGPLYWDATRRWYKITTSFFPGIPCVLTCLITGKPFHRNFRKYRDFDITCKSLRYEAGSAKNFPRGGSRANTRSTAPTEAFGQTFNAVPHKTHARSVSDRPACADCVARVILEPRAPSHEFASP